MMNPRKKTAIANAQVEGSRVSASVVEWSKRSRYNPIRVLTPEYLARVMDTFATGFLREFAILQDAIRRRDSTVRVALAKREKAVARHGFQILTNDGLDDASKVRAQKHADALRYFFTHCTATDVMEQDQSGGFNLLVRQMMSAQAFRYAVHEIVWKPVVDPVTQEARLTAEFVYVPVWFFESTSGKLRFVSNIFGGLIGEDMDPDEWLVTVGEGIMEAIAVNYMFKMMPLKDWVAFSGRLGTPTPHGKTSAPKDSPAWTAMEDAVRAIGEGGSVVTSLDGVIEMIEAKGGSANLPFPELVNYCDKQNATICRGGDLSTISSGAGAQGRGGSLQGDETDLLEEDDAELVSEALKKISRIVVQQVCGDAEPLARVAIIVPEKKNNTDTINKVTAIVNAGGRVEMSWYMSELGVPPAPAETKPEALVAKVVAPIAKPDIPEKQAIANSSAQERAAEAHLQSTLATFAQKHQRIARDAIFRAEALKKLSTAQSEALRPLTDRLAEIADIEDETAQQAALVKLQRDLPAMYRRIAKDPTVASAFEEILGAAIASGAAEAAQAQRSASAKP